MLALFGSPSENLTFLIIKLDFFGEGSIEGPSNGREFLSFIPFDWQKDRRGGAKFSDDFFASILRAFLAIDFTLAMSFWVGIRGAGNFEFDFSKAFFAILYD